MIVLPDGIAATDALLAKLDQCWMAGFAHLSAEHKYTLNLVRQLFADTPLAEQLATALEAIYKGVYQPEHLRVLAAARASLQGAQYDHIRQAVNTALKRQPLPEPPPQQHETLLPTEPLVKGAAHWLMDIALQGFARLEAGELSAFDSTLTQLQAKPDRMPLVAVLNGLLDELSGAVPVTAPDTAPLFRWVDLWSRALLMTAPQPERAYEPVSGALYLMGVEWRTQRRLVSVVFYGILALDDGAVWVRTTFSAYKVNAIQREETALLLPQIALLLRALRDGDTLQLQNMRLLSTGDLLWDEQQAVAGKSYKLIEVAQRYLAQDAAEALHIPPLPAEKRHPVHVAVPVVLAQYRVDDGFVEAGGLRLQVDQRRICETELDLPTLAKHNHLVGLVRYDNQQLLLQPLAAVNKMHLPVFIGIKDTLKLFDAPPKDSTVALLQERASRLLREK